METFNKYTCAGCGNEFQRSLRQDYKNRLQGQAPYCSKKCRHQHANTQKLVSCLHCGTEFYKVNAALIKYPNSFCNHSCAAIYNNTHKTKGFRRSKLEIYLEEELPKLFPTLDFVFNGKSAINSELDIYIPSLKLAFELNGIFHYEPIYGEEKLSQIQNNDERKYQACIEFGIELCIIDSSGFKHFKVDKAKKYLDIVSQIINSKL